MNAEEVTLLENAVEVGVIQVVGDTDELTTVYESAD